MGFYAPAQIVRDARQHGIEVRPVDVNHSRWDCTLEPTGDKRFAVRLGFRLIRGLANDDGAIIPLARLERPFSSVEDLWRRAGRPVTALEKLANADAFVSLGIDRRQAIWAIHGLSDEILPLFTAADEREQAIQPEIHEPAVQLTPMTEGREVVEDYLSKGLTLRRHPVSFLRQELTERRIISCSELHQVRDGQRATVAGLVLVRQKPGTAKGVTFMTIEDETDVANIVIWSSLFEKQRRLLMSSGMIGCRGRLQREGQVTHLIAEHFLDFSDLLRSVGDRDIDVSLQYERDDEARTSVQRLLKRSRRVSEDRLAAQEPDGPTLPTIKVTTRDFK